MDRTYFFDTYAIIEVLKGSDNYTQLRNVRIITSKLNIFEVYYYLLRTVGEEIAKEIAKEYYKYVTDYDLDTISEASKLKHELRKREISMTDCIGYILSKKYKVPFLTGDLEFENMENVAFVK